MKTAIILAALMVAASTQAQMVLWTFNDSAGAPSATENLTLGTPTLFMNGSNADSNGTTGNAFVDASGTSHSAGTAGRFLQNGGNNASVDMSFNSTGFTDLVLSFDYRSSSATPITLHLPGISTFQITEDGEWHRVQVNLEAALWNNASADLQIHTYQSFGARSNLAWDIDNVQINAVPEPQTYAALFGAGLLGLAIHRRVKAQRAGI